MVLRSPKKRVVQTVVHLPPFTMESRIPMVLIQLDTVGSLEFLRGTQLLSGSPSLTSELRGFLATSIGSQMAYRYVAMFGIVLEKFNKPIRQLRIC